MARWLPRRYSWTLLLRLHQSFSTDFNWTLTKSRSACREQRQTHISREQRQVVDTAVTYPYRMGKRGEAAFLFAFSAIAYVALHGYGELES